MTLQKINDMGIPYDVSVVASVDSYVIYTDFTTDQNGELRLYVGKINQLTIEDVSLEESNTIMKQFKDLEKNQFGLKKRGDYYEL